MAAAAFTSAALRAAVPACTAMRETLRAATPAAALSFSLFRAKEPADAAAAAQPTAARFLAFHSTSRCIKLAVWTRMLCPSHSPGNTSVPWCHDRCRPSPPPSSNDCMPKDPDDPADCSEAQRTEEPAAADVAA